jgi:class 3 adenylate cyclase/TolB-like protein
VVHGRRNAERRPRRMEAPRQANVPLSVADLRVRSTIIAFADVAEFDRLLQRDELVAGKRLLNFLVRAERELVPSNGGTCLQRVGDGLVLEFDEARDASRCAEALHQLALEHSANLSEEDCIRMRIGIYAGDVLTDDVAYFGRGINLAERLSKLCQPGQTVVSAAIRDQLTSGVDAEIEDLGECFIKHGTSLRAYRLWPVTWTIRYPAPSKVTELLRPTIAVVPLSARTNDPQDAIVGEVLADELIAVLSRSRDLRIISRLSSSALKERALSPSEIGAHLHAQFTFTGAYRISSGRLTVNIELANTQNNEVIWAGRYRDRVDALAAGTSDFVGQIASEAIAALVAAEVRRTTVTPLPTLDAYSLLFAGIGLMHRARFADFDRAREVFEHLIERFPRHATPAAWLAAWHVFKVTQGWFTNLTAEVAFARSRVQRALDCNPLDPLALTLHGLVHTNLVRDHDVARASYDQAIQSNPNESLALLHRGTLAAFQDRGQDAIADTELASRLSPLDPWKYYYDALAATAALSAEDYEGALRLARRSIRANRTHASTLRAIAISCVELGRIDDARDAIAQLLELDKNLTVKSWFARTPSADYPTGKRWAASLQRAGLPD